mmetsp:Transcript_5143/g.11401  ORF Transcript_5143/g.11401 Transcript_5143/m.11401 type:complete len:206 (+) Transcript_5143:594-1211(+)
MYQLQIPSCPFSISSELLTPAWYYMCSPPRPVKIQKPMLSNQVHGPIPCLTGLPLRSILIKFGYVVACGPSCASLLGIKRNRTSSSVLRCMNKLSPSQLRVDVIQAAQVVVCGFLICSYMKTFKLDHYNALLSMVPKFVGCPVTVIKKNIMVTSGEKNASRVSAAHVQCDASKLNTTVRILKAMFNRGRDTDVANILLIYSSITC